MDAKRVAFTGKQQVELQPFEVPTPNEGQVLLKTHYTLMSTGTENIVFNRLFDSGTHWDNWVKYPFFPGYSAICEVVELGSGVNSSLLGKRVAVRRGHSSHHIAGASDAVPVPDSINSEEAAWHALAKIAFMGVRASDYHIGDSVLIIGAGPIGQMSVRWAAAAGLQHVIVVDPAPARLRLAQRGGATAVIDAPVEQCREAVLAATGGKLPQIVNDSTGHSAVFAAALGLADKFGRVVILGDTGTPATQHLTGDVITRGITVIGAHDGHSDATWNDRTITPLLYSLAERGRFDLKELTSHVFRPEQAALGTKRQTRAAPRPWVSYSTGQRATRNEAIVFLVVLPKPGGRKPRPAQSGPRDRVRSSRAAKPGTSGDGNRLRSCRRQPQRPRLIGSGLNDTTQHDRIAREIDKSLALAVKLGIPNLIVFSGDRRDGVSDDEGADAICAGVKRIIKSAEDAGVTLVMELLNSKVDHKGYQCDRTPWLVDIAKRIDSPSFKALYDIYHMQIMEGDIIRTIQQYSAHIGHYHTAGVPGRHDLDDTQELYYPAIFRAIMKTGYNGFVGHEFIPSGDPVAGLRQAYELCDAAAAG